MDEFTFNANELCVRRISVVDDTLPSQSKKKEGTVLSATQISRTKRIYQVSFDAYLVHVALDMGAVVLR